MECVRLNAALINLESDLRYHRALRHETDEFIRGYLPDCKVSPSQKPIKPEGREGVYRNVTAVEQRAVTKSLLAELTEEEAPH